mgnify:FL=1
MGLGVDILGMSQTLYRKYRPQNFSDLTGQNHIKITLENEIITGKIAHAYLFCGPRGIGKTTSARLLAKAVNCQNRQADSAEPCNQCDSCREITDGRSLDVMEVDAASHTGVDNVRENIIDNARFSPSRSKYKIFIIDEVHMLSPSAFNALLKTIEEPPAHVIFVLATTETHKVPATIISRCQRFDFRRINAPDLIERLSRLAAGEGIDVSKKVLERIARESEGCLRDAESLLGQIISMGGKKIDLDTANIVLPSSDFSLVFGLIKYLAVKNAAGGVKFLNELINDGVDLNQFAVDAVEVLRKMLLFKVDESLAGLALEYDEELERGFRELAAKFESREILKMIEVFLEKKTENKTSSIPQFPLELGIISLCLGVPKEAAPGVGEIKFPPQNMVFMKKGDTPAIQADQLSQCPSGGPALAAGCEEPEEVHSFVRPIFGQENINIGLEEIKEKWNVVADKIGEVNASLPISMRLCRPVSLNGDKLTIVTSYGFHRDRLEEFKNKVVLQKALEDIFNAKLMIAVEVQKDEEIIAESAAPDAAQDLAAEFGGRVI